MICKGCNIKFAVLEEKILWRGKLFHRICLSKKIAAKKRKEKNMIFLIDDEHLAHASMPGVYNVYLYTPKK
jgi:hypothetical protein